MKIGLTPGQVSGGALALKGNKAMRIAHVLVCHSVEPWKLLESVPDYPDSPWYVYFHGDSVEMVVGVEKRLARRNLAVRPYMQNRGLSKSWNEAIEAALTDDCDAILLLNDDLFFLDGGYEIFRRNVERIALDSDVGLITAMGIESGGSPYAGEIRAQNFSCVVLTKRAIEDVGFFDERFFPAYFEDSDYSRRVQLAGLKYEVISDVVIEHERSSTIRTLNEQDRSTFENRFEANRSLFEAKWGGMPGQETFRSPFASSDGIYLPLVRTAELETVVASGGEVPMTKLDERRLSDVHTDVHYSSLMATISAVRQPKIYLEIGVSTGELFQHITAEHGVCVDPNFDLRVNITSKKRKVSLFQETSDTFFSRDIKQELGGNINLAFLDGMHLFEFLLRDFYNTEAACTSQSLIAVHDCFPVNAEMAIRDMNEAVEAGRATSFPDHWTGDVWKIIPILMRYRPDLRLVWCASPPTGVLLISNLDPSSSILKDKYFEIVDEFSRMGNRLEDIAEVFEETERVGGDVVSGLLTMGSYLRI